MTYLPKKGKKCLYRFIVLGIYNFETLLRVRESLVTKKMNRDVSSWGGQFWRRADTQWTKKPLIWFINMQVKIQKESSKFLLRSLNLTILIGCILILNWFFGCDVRLLTKQGGLLYFIIFLQNALKEIQNRTHWMVQTVCLFWTLV